MLVQELERKGIGDMRVLEAINKVPRHVFFESVFWEHAYEDRPFPIGEGQTITQPYTVAYQTELLEVEERHKVLEIGTGSGYQACILAELGARVFTVEIIESLYRNAERQIRSLGYSSVKTFLGDGSVGFIGEAPFDRILVTAAAPHIPKALVDQLKVGGCLVIPVGSRNRQQMIRVRKLAKNELQKEVLAPFIFVPLRGQEGWRS